MHIALPAPVSTALDRLYQNGYEAYVVGGCVRDTILGREPGDWDITTSALPEDTMRVFSGYTTIPTGIRHGTVTVVIDGMPLEITTYRIDGTYADSRHPDSVQFTTALKEDLRRRDFTINAMAYAPGKGMIDHFSGLADLADGRIACVGDPQQRFTEDALRILRALRFSSVLDFPLEKMTAAAARRLSPLLRSISAERIAAELIKLLCGKGVRRVLLEFSDVLCVILPELHPTLHLQQDNPYHHLTVYEHIVETVAAVPPQPVLRLAMLFHDLGKPACYTRDEQGVDHFRGHPAISTAMAERVLERLRFDKKTIHDVTKLVLHHDDTLSVTDKALKRLLNRLGPELAILLVEIQKADVCGQHPDKRDDRLTYLEQIKLRLSELIDEKACFSMDRLAISGKNLLEMGYSPGPRIGNVLQTLLEAVMDGDYPNEPSSLLKKAKEML